jgi:hypothetical protein
MLGTLTIRITVRDLAHNYVSFYSIWLTKVLTI